MTKETTFDVDALIGGSLDSITSKLADLSDNELVHLRRAETASAKPRDGLFKALDAEEKGRADAAAAKAKDEADAAPKGPTIADLIAQLDDRDATIATQAQRITDLEAAVVAAGAKAGKTKPAKAIEFEQIADELTLEGAREILGSGELRVHMVGEGDVSLPDYPPMLFGGHQFAFENGQLVLNAGIAFPRDRPETAVTALFLTGPSGKRGLRAQLVQPLIVGGGKLVELPSGHMGFTPASAPIAAATT